MEPQHLVPCPVCTLFLREGMSMHSHLNTHPKDQVIEALVRLYTQDRPLNLQQIPQNVPPPHLINPFQVVSEEHIFLGRQQVTNIIHTPLMSYPIYSQQQVLGTGANEYLPNDMSRPELLSVAPTQPEPLITTLINVPDNREYEQQQSNEEQLDQKVEIEEQNEKCYIEIQNAPLHSPASNHSGISVRTDLTNNEREQGGEYITSDCDFQDEDARHSEDLIDNGEYDDNQLTPKELTEEDHITNEDLERSSSGLNIQADECMPARGELSGHGSIGNTVNSIWIREEPMHSVPAPWEERKDTKKKYMCLYCEQEFNCPKERRVHVATLHCNQYSKQTLDKSPMCTKCGLQLSSQNELKVHTRTEHKKVSRQCGICNEEFLTQELYMEHIVKIHPLECRTCGKTFHSKPSLYAHAKIHLQLKPHACTLCPKTFITTQKLKEHMNGHTGYAPIQCNLCERRFKRYSNLKQHKDSAHFHIKKKVKEFFCECGETFVTKKKLEWHREIHADKPKQCMYCSERYVHSASLTRHIRKAHNSEYLPDSKDFKKKNVNCPICNATFVESSLRAHMKQHGAAKQFGCIVCGKKFLTKWNLHLHRWTHASRMSKPYKCTMCKGAFIRQSDLQAHIRAHYGNKPFTCNHCGMQFNRKHNWLRHEKEHNSEKKYTCEECGKTFHRNYYLVDHLRIHTGVKPYSCHICNKTSSTKSNHNKHIRTHHAREAINTES